MDLIIYVKNISNEYIGTYKLNSDYISTEKNYNKRFLKALLESLKIKKLNLYMFKCLGKRNETYYYLVKVSSSKLFLTIPNFELLENTKEEFISKSLFLSYRAKILKSKHHAVRSAFFNKFGIKNIVLLITEVVVFALTLYLKLEDTLKNDAVYIIIISVLLLIITNLKKLVNAFFDALEFRKTFELSHNFEIENESILDNVLKNYRLSKKYRNFNHMTFVNGDTFIYSDLENANLSEFADGMRVKKIKTNDHLSDDSRNALGFIIGNKLDNDKNIFNGKLLGINSDLVFHENQEIEIKNVRYHNYVSTDEMIYRNIMSATRYNKMIKGTDVCLNPLTKSLNDINNSHLTNLIGINLIVEIKYNNQIYYIVNTQSLYNDVNQAKLVPSSSGSLDQNDYSYKNMNFKNLLLTGMLRELYEESYLDFELRNNKIVNLNNFTITSIDFKLLGFGRLVSKAGKPDFFGKLTLATEDESLLNRILDNYDLKQNLYLGSKTDIETTSMLILTKEQLFNYDKKLLSSQLQYVIYLLKNSK